MAGVLDIARDYAQSHPMSVATGLIVVLPATYLLVAGKAATCAFGLCNTVPTPSYSAIADTTTGDLSVYRSQHPLDLRLNLPISKWSDKPAPTFTLQIIEGTRKNIISSLIATGERFGVDFHNVLIFLEDRWADHFPLSRFGLVAIATTLPGAFLVFIRNYPDSWAARYQIQVANALHILTLVIVANERISAQDFLVTALVVLSFEAFRRSLSSDSAGYKEVPAAVEKQLSQTHSLVAKSDIVVPLPDAIDDSQNKSHEVHPAACTDDDTLQLQMTLTRALADAKTSIKVKEIELKRTQNDLRNARDTLNETFAEYSNLRDEMKTVKQAIGRDHQAVIYRKDIELFALRKGNAQKDNCIKDKETRLATINHQHKAVLELKDAQLRNLKEQVGFLERNNRREEVDGELKGDSQADGDHQAVQVKLLRVKGRSSLDMERSNEDKDNQIAKLKGELADAAKDSETLAAKQNELQRAWDAASEAQNALTEEQQMHVQTREKLQEVVVELGEEVKKNSQRHSPTRLPTIEEQDKTELETMFNATQQDNLRLYSELDVLDKRVRDANARVFACDQEVATLKEQLRLEKAINEEMETARPSLVHRVHFQRMESQLMESREALGNQEDEISRLKEDGVTKNRQIEDLKKAKEAVLLSHGQLQKEGESLEKTIKDLESTKEQLMLDHERLAQHRSRQRTTSAEHTSARSSDATLIADSSIQALMTSDEPLPVLPVTLVEPDSIQNTPTRHYKPDTNRFSMISNDIPPSELRTARKKSHALKNFVRKIVSRDPEAESKPSKGKEAVKAQQQPRPKTALALKDKNTLMRPTIAAPLLPKLDTDLGKEKVKVVPRPQTAAPTRNNRQTPTSASLRYYAAQEHLAEKEDSGVDASFPRPKSRGWGTSRKLIKN